GRPRREGIEPFAADASEMVGGRGAEGLERTEFAERERPADDRTPDDDEDDDERGDTPPRRRLAYEGKHPCAGASDLCEEARPDLGTFAADVAERTARRQLEEFTVADLR